MLVITMFSGAFLLLNYTSAESSTSTASVTVPEACTMTSTNNTPHTATLSPNTYSGASGSDYENGIGKTTLSVVCNDYNGFSIYAIGYTGNSYDSANHTKLVGSNTGNTIATAVYTNNTTPSNWSMKVTKVTDSSVSYNPTNMSIQNSFDSWHAVPDTYTKVAQYHASTGSSTTDTTLGAKVETTYAAFIAENQSADTYIGQVKYTMVHPYDYESPGPQITESNCIRYYKNGLNVEGTMGCQPVTSSDTSLTLLASNFSREGYGFAGWSDKFDYATNSEAHFYGPQEDITFTAGQYAGTNPGLSLYAIWIKSEGSIQDSSKVSQVCSRLTQSGPNITKTLNSVSALTDQRDNETYAIAKLADGNCWMIENLRLESTNSDNRTGALAQGYGTSSTYGNFSGLADAESANFTNTNPPVANSLYYSGTQSGDASINIGTTDYPAYRMPRYNNTNTSTRATNNPASNDSVMYSYGNYYSWHAAIADLTYNGGVDQSSTGTSLCPKGWHLPTGGRAFSSNNTGTVNVAGNPETFREFYKLGYAIMGNNLTAYESNTGSFGSAYYGTNTTNAAGDTATKAFRKYPNNFIYSGTLYSSSVNSRGSNGCYWSSTVYSSYNGNHLSLSSNSVSPGTSSGNKYVGQSIRCLNSS